MPTPDTKICLFCGREFELTYERKHNWRTKRFCGKKCAGHFHGDTHKYTRAQLKAKSVQKERERRENAEGKRAEKAKPRTWKCWDDEVDHPANVAQRELDRAIDTKLNIDLSCRVIKPDDPDFAELCKSITPIERVKKTERVIDTYLSDFDPSSIHMTRRNENINDNRG